MKSIWPHSKIFISHQQMQVICGYSCWKAGQNYLQSTSGFWWKECHKSVKQGAFLMNRMIVFLWGWGLYFLG